MLIQESFAWESTEAGGGSTSNVIEFLKENIIFVFKVSFNYFISMFSRMLFKMYVSFTSQTELLVSLKFLMIKVLSFQRPCN